MSGPGIANRREKTDTGEVTRQEEKKKPRIKKTKIHTQP